MTSHKIQRSPKLWLPIMLMLVSLACATNTPAARLSPPRATRTPLPTFTLTPIPPTPTPLPSATDTPLPTDTPPPTDTPLPTNTPAPADTPVPPTNTPLPPPPTQPPAPPTQPPPPTATFTPEPPPVPVSPVGTPTFTPVPGSPAGRYKLLKIKRQKNCAHIGIIGKVVDGDDEDDDPIAGVTIRVVGDEDGFRGPYYATSGSDGKYSIVLGEYGSVPDRVEFRADIFGDGVDTDDEPEWKFSKDCGSSDPLQIIEIIWYKRGD